MTAPLNQFYSQRTALSGVSYILTFRYNARMDRWIMDVADSNATLLLAGIPILGRWAGLRRFNKLIPGLPVGALAAVDLTGADRDPQESTFGNDVPLFYLVEP